jgi:hypothetical protein
MTHDVLAASVSSFGNTSFCRLPSWAKTKAFNPHHRRRPPFSDSPTPTLYSYKKVISTLPPFLDSPTHILYNYKRSSQHWSLSPPFNRVSILPPPKLEYHAIRAPPVVVVPFHRHPTPIVSLHNDTHDDKLVDLLSLPDINMWIHIKRYFKIPQHHACLSTSYSFELIFSALLLNLYK